VRLCNQASNADVKLCTKFERQARAIETLLETSLEEGNKFEKVGYLHFLIFTLRECNSTASTLLIMDVDDIHVTDGFKKRCRALYLVLLYRK